MKISDIINSLPEFLKQMVGKVIIPDDGGLAISEAIVEGRCLGASDGSLLKGFRKQKGSHGYAIGKKDDNIETIKGFGPSPDSDSMSSMTTEHYGLIGLLVLLHILCKKYLLCRQECFDSVIIVIDNKTVVERSNKEQEVINLSDYGVPDQELWALTSELRSKLPIDLEIKWIKGHQNANEYGMIIQGPFLHEIEMNILVDKLAEKGMKMSKNKILRRENLSHEVLSIHNREGVLINDLRKFMVEKVNGRDLLDYIERRKRWNEETSKSIEWEGIEGMLKKTNPIKRIKLVKMLFSWQNTGCQKGKIRDAKLRAYTDNPTAPTEEEAKCHLCPSGCGEEETALHFLHCPTIQNVRERYELITKVLKKLKLVRTYEGICAVVRLILTRISDREEMDFVEELMDNDGELSLARTMGGQKRIGWLELCQGFCHRGWAIVQGKYYRKNGIETRSLNKERWKKMFSTILAEYSMDC